MGGERWRERPIFRIRLIIPRLDAMKNGGVENVRACIRGAACIIPRQPKSYWIYYSWGLNYGRNIYGTRAWAPKCVGDEIIIYQLRDHQCTQRSNSVASVVEQITLVKSEWIAALRYHTVLSKRYFRIRLYTL